MTLPTVYLPHGAGPCFFMEWTRGPADTWDKTAAWLKGLVAGLPASDYRWEYGRLRVPKIGAHLTYLIGAPS